MGRLTESVGRFFRAVATVLTFGLVKFSERVEQDPRAIKLDYEDVIKQKATAAEQLKNALGGLIGQQEMIIGQHKEVLSTIAGLERERDGFYALMEERRDALRGKGTADEQITQDAEMARYIAAYNDASSTLEAKKQHAEDLKSQIDGLQTSIDNTVIQGQQLAREVQRLQAEKHEAVASMVVNQNLDRINSALAGIATNGADDRLAGLRQRVAEMRGRAAAAERIAGTDVTVDREKARQAAMRHATNAELLGKLGLKSKAAPASPVAAPVVTIAQTGSKDTPLPEGKAGNA